MNLVRREGPPERRPIFFDRGTDRFQFQGQGPGILPAPARARLDGQAVGIDMFPWTPGHQLRLSSPCRHGRAARDCAAGTR